MLNERSILLHLLIGGDEAMQSAAVVAADGNLWPRLVELAFRWKVLPVLNDKLSSLRIELGDDSRAGLRRLSTESFLRSASVAQRGAETLELLANGGVQAAAFKGLAVLALHGGNRTLQDVDILIEEENLGTAVQLLEGKGYLTGMAGSLPEYITFVRNSPGFAGNEAMVVTGPQGGEIDLHWRVGPRNVGRFKTGDLLSRARQIRFRNRGIRVLGAIDLALLTAHHALRNNFVPDETIRDLIDMDAWVVSIQRDHDLAEFIRVAEASSLLSSVMAMIGIPARMKPGSAVAGTSVKLRDRADPKTSDDARVIEELFFAQLDRGPLNQDLLYLLGVEPLKRILVGGMSGWSRYRRHMRVLETKKGGAPLSLGYRVSRLWSSARRASRRDWSQLRLLSRLKG